jgi:hypothetical protein
MIFSSLAVRVCGAARRMSSKYCWYSLSFGCSAIYRSMVGLPTARISGRIHAVADCRSV